MAHKYPHGVDFEDESQRAVTHILFFEIRFPRLSGNVDKEVLNSTGLDMLLVKILNFFNSMWVPVSWSLKINITLFLSFHLPNCSTV